MRHLTPRLSCAFVRALALRQQAKRATKRQMQCLVMTAMLIATLLHCGAIRAP